jgi:2-octaprenyl-6-methoxyphenol hydroxylase
VGAALALALCGDGDSALRVTVLEARAERGPDPRPIALSYGSRLLLERLHAWPELMAHAAPTPISNIHVSQRGAFGRVAISASDAGVPALGYVVDYGAVHTALAQAARRTPCDYREGARVTAIHHDGGCNRIGYLLDGSPASLRARLTVVADGGDIDGLAPAKSVAYNQHALTARVRTALPAPAHCLRAFHTRRPVGLAAIRRRNGFGVDAHTGARTGVTSG